MPYYHLFEGGSTIRLERNKGGIENLQGRSGQNQREKIEYMDGEKRRCDVDFQGLAMKRENEDEFEEWHADIYEM
ncbi:hypothetical protein GWI33_000151 [Rhynchophorus ferrugineus]|uniref:Uncharacterized protein n=1 Tax=Rhynchophorus ferrugineus TaxID=354439 RepID=A0A834J0P5_RHYFE|nr:hypothetical protein GWI33_000151 [Rhynchophorus ferrugineus]